MATTMLRSRAECATACPRAAAARLFHSPKVEPIAVPDRASPLSSLSPEIQFMALEATEHYQKIGGAQVYGHALEVLSAAVQGKLLPASTNGADTFSRQVAELILYHPFESDAYLPGTGMSPGFERRFALHSLFKHLDSAGGRENRMQDYVRLLNDPANDPADLLVVLYTRIADMMTVHEPATIRAAAAASVMPGIFPVHGSWDAVKASWAEPMLKVYCAVADWHGQTFAYRRMRDNAVRYLYPDKFAEAQRESCRWLSPLMNTTAILHTAVRQLAERLNLRLLIANHYTEVSHGLPYVDERTAIVSIRPFKGIGGLLNKSLFRGIPMEEVHDWSGLTVIADTPSRMYSIVEFLCEEGFRSASSTFGIHRLGAPSVVDYAQDPKPVTNYRSVHVDTGAGSPSMLPIEALIRTPDMHVAADEGIAGHDRYKLSPLVNGERRRFDEVRARIASRV